MAKTKIFEKDVSGKVEFNMTPMIDCTFLLIIFFILSATVLNDALAELELHRPFKSEANENKDLNEVPNRIIVNVVSEEKDKKKINSLVSASPKEYMINGKTIEIGDDSALVERIRQGAIAARDSAEKYDAFYVEIRADHRVKFGAVQAVLKSAAKAGIRGIETKMNITALTDIGQ